MQALQKEHDSLEKQELKAKNDVYVVETMALEISNLKKEIKVLQKKNEALQKKMRKIGDLIASDSGDEDDESD